jgi:hypothetical protein
MRSFQAGADCIESLNSRSELLRFQVFEGLETIAAGLEQGFALDKPSSALGLVQTEHVVGV